MIKKWLKRIGAAFLASALSLTLCLAAGAEDLRIRDNLSLTLTNVPDGAAFKVYTVAAASVNLGDQAYTYAAQDPFTKTDITTLATLNENTPASAVQTEAATLKAKITPETSVTATLDKEHGYKSSGLSTGYYLILMDEDESKTNMIASPMLVSLTNATNTVEVKSSYIPFDKTITEVKDGKGTVAQDAHTAVAEIGSTVSYAITSQIPRYDASVSVKELANSFTITDNPSDGLTITDDQFKKISVKVGGADVKAADDTYKIQKNNPDDKGFTIVFENSYVLANQGKAVSVTFDASINDFAVLKDAGNPNNAELSYTNNYFGTGNPAKEEGKTYVYTTGIKIVKTDGKNTALQGVGFTLYSEDGNTVVKDELKTDDKGLIYFKGLNAGTYTLKETTTLTGYTKIADSKIEITATKDGNTYTGTFTAKKVGKEDMITPVEETEGTEKGNKYFDLAIKNVKGITLPGTGAMGAPMILAGGVILVVLAGVLLLLYRKKQH